MRPIHAIASFALLAGACGTDSTTTGDDDTSTAPTWYQDVAPIMSSHCMSCHQAGGIAPFSLTTYADAKENATNAATRIDSGEMPPWNASTEADCAPSRSWKDDPTLSAADKQTIHDWIDGGMLEGTEAPITPPAGTDLPNKTLTMTPTQSFTTAGMNDQFECFVLDPQVTTNVAWMTGLQVRPGNPAVVHHAVISEVAPGPDLDALLAAHPVGTPFNCEAGTPANFVMAIWTPGNQPMETPDGQLAVPIQKGAMVVMQIHYHPANITNDPDTTSVDIRLSQTWPQKMYFVAAFGNAANAPNLLPDPDDTTTTPEFTIPANKADHVENMTFTMPDLSSLGPDVRIYSVNPHMHLTGTHINGKLTRAVPGNEPATECLANGGWNFDWQRTYTYDTPLDQLPSVHTGDTLAINCHWNNTIENPFVQRMMHDSGLGQPIDIHLGEMTTNEMCLEIFGIAINAPAQPTGLAPVTFPKIGLNMSSL